MIAHFALLPGDGIGPEVMVAAEAVLDTVAQLWGHQFHYQHGSIGGAAIDRDGSPLPELTRQLCQQVDAVLLGAVGGPRWDHCAQRPEQGLLALRQDLGVYANLRPVCPHPRAAQASPIKPELLRGVDLLVVRELTGGLYFGAKEEGLEYASDHCAYHAEEVDRVVRCAAALALSRRGKLCLVDKANVLATSRLWRQRTTALIAREFPQLELEILLVDAAAMHLLSRPASFDVIVTENLFGDILTDEAAMLAGSLGLLPSASLGAGRRGLYEPIHGSAPDIAGLDRANPCAMVLSAALALRHSLQLEDAAQAVEQAVTRCLDRALFTADLGGNLGTQAMTAAIIDELRQFADESIPAPATAATQPASTRENAA